MVDPFPIWSYIPQLQRVFGEPSILKVFHGAYKDIEWLARDFGIRVANLFDTFFAAKFLKDA